MNYISNLPLSALIKCNWYQLKISILAQYNYLSHKYLCSDLPGVIIPIGYIYQDLGRITLDLQGDEQFLHLLKSVLARICFIG